MEVTVKRKMTDTGGSVQHHQTQLVVTGQTVKSVLIISRPLGPPSGSLLSCVVLM